MSTPRSCAFRSCIALVLTVSACRHGTGAADVAPPPPPAPARPNDVLLQAHLGQPRATLGVAARVAQMGLIALADPVTLMGIDGNIAAVVDATHPIDVLLTGTPDHPEYAIVLSPTSATAMRDTLNASYRMTTSPAVGDLLEPRTPRRPSQPFCAVVRVPDAMPVRIVCASRAEALQHAGRYAAFASLPLGADHTDVRVEVDVATARSVLLPAAHQALDSATHDLSVTASRQRDRGTDVSDPAAAMASIATLGHELDLDAADLRALVGRVTLSPVSATLEIDMGVVANGPSAIAHDAAGRIGQPSTHVLATRLAPDSAFALASHSVAADRIATWNTGVTSIVSMFGTHLGDPAAATHDLQALFAQAGDEFAFGGTMQGDAPEGIALVSTSDGGAGARAALTAMATSVWLRTAVTSAGLPLPTFAGDVLTFAPPAPAPAPTVHAPPGAHTTPSAPGGSAERANTPLPARPPPSVALGVSGDVLALVISATPAVAFAEIAGRANVALPTVLAGIPAASVQGGFNPSALGPGAPAGVFALTYDVSREADVLTGHFRLTAPTSTLAGLAAAFRPRSAPPVAP